MKAPLAGFMTFILSVGRAPELLRPRSLILHSAGYAVLEELDCERALSRAMNDDIDLVLLCYSLHPGEIEFLVKMLAEKRRMLPVLCIRKTNAAMHGDNYTPTLSHLNPLLDEVDILLAPRTA